MKKLLFILLCLLSAPAFGQINASPTFGQGVWTPAVTASSTAGTPTYTTQIGSYITIGNYVYVQFNIVLSGWTGSPSGNVTITGLPYTATATTSDNGGCVITNYAVTGLTASNYGIYATIAPSATVATLLEHSNTGTANVTAALTGTTPTLIGFCNYHM